MTEQLTLQMCGAPHNVRFFLHSKSYDQELTCPGVHPVPPILTQYATVSLVRAPIQMIRYAMAFGRASHYVLVSGDSVPLISPQELVETLSDSKESCF
jgi:hypothetical protein